MVVMYGYIVEPNTVTTVKLSAASMKEKYEQEKY